MSQATVVKLPLTMSLMAQTPLGRVDVTGNMIDE